MKKKQEKSVAQEAAESKHVLVLRTCDANGKSHSRFQWPEKGPVECNDWDPTPRCGGGLHGLAWGDGDWSLLNSSHDAKWQVVKVPEKDIVAIDGHKVKFPRGEVLYTGNMADAMAMVLADRWRIEQLVAAIQKENAEKEAKNKSGGDLSVAASSGYSSKAASSGYSSTAASSGDSSTAASSGYSSKAASSGDSSTAASSGYSSKAASSGDSSKAASSGDYSTAASSGYSSKAASSGYSSKAASSGDFSKAASSGYSSKAASSGDFSTAASSGDSSTAASSGDSSTAAAKGKNTIAMAAGHGCAVSAGENGCFATAYWDEKAKRYRILVGYVGEDGIEPETDYRIEKGKFVPVTAKAKKAGA